MKIKSLHHHHLPLHSSSAERDRRSPVQDPNKCYLSAEDLSGNRREAEEAAWLGEISEVSNYECLCLFCDGNWRIMPRGRCSGQPCEGNKQVMEVVPAPRRTNGVFTTRTHTFRCTRSQRVTAANCSCTSSPAFTTTNAFSEVKGNTKLLLKYVGALKVHQDLQIPVSSS